MPLQEHGRSRLLRTLDARFLLPLGYPGIPGHCVSGARSRTQCGLWTCPQDVFLAESSRPGGGQASQDMHPALRLSSMPAGLPGPGLGEGPGDLLGTVSWALRKVMGGCARTAPDLPGRQLQGADSRQVAATEPGGHCARGKHYMRERKETGERTGEVSGHARTVNGSDRCLSNVAGTGRE